MVPGTGSRVLLAGVHGVGAEACHVAITWVTIHAKILQQMLNPGSPVRHLLFTAKEDVRWMEGRGGQHPCSVPSYEGCPSVERDYCTVGAPEEGTQKA